jgi:uncharacterized membrane protein
MKAFLNFLRHSITGGILVIIPIAIILWLIGKIKSILDFLSIPFKDKLPELFWGLDGSRLFAILLLLILCFLAGFAFRTQMVKKFIDLLEDNILIYIPGYVLLKSITADALHEEHKGALKTVFVEEDDAWKIGFLIEENEEYSIIYYLEAPKHDSGEVMIVPSKYVHKTDIPSHVTSRYLKSYGKGLLQHIKKNELVPKEILEGDEKADS